MSQLIPGFWSISHTLNCKASSIQVSLVYGYIVVKISSNGEETTLTSLRTYANGAEQFFSLSLSSSQDHVRTLILQTSLEKTTQFTDLEPKAVVNHTDIFLCGVPNNLTDVTEGIANLTGCAAFSSNVMLVPLPLTCHSAGQDEQCSYCLNEAR